MNLNTLGNIEWKSIIDHIDKNTGKFTDNKVLAKNNDLIAFFSSVTEALNNGFTPVDPQWILDKSYQLLTKKDDEQIIKIGAFVTRIIHNLDAKETLFPFLKKTENASDFTPEELEKDAKFLMEYYSHYKLPEMLKVAHRLLDRASDLYLLQNMPKEADRIRFLQLGGMPQPNLNIFHSQSHLWPTSEGQFIDSLDTEQIKQGCLHIASFPVAPGRQIDRLDFKVSYPEREMLQKRIDALKNQQPDKLPAKFSQGISITDQTHQYISKEDPKVTYQIGKVQEIEFKGVGKVKIGSSKLAGSLYNRITVEVEHTGNPEKSIQDAYAMLTFLGLGGSFHLSSESDEQRKKVMALFRHFFPREIYGIEIDPILLAKGGYELRSYLESKFPESKPYFKKYLDEHPELMTKEEVFKNKSVYSIADVASEMRKSGAQGLIRGVSGDSPEKIIEKVIKVLEEGTLSTQDRFDRGNFQKGASAIEDHAANSADQVFMRLLTVRILKSNKKISEFPLSGEVQFLIRLDILNRGCYMHTSDHYGEKNRSKGMEIQPFKERLNPLEFTQRLESTPLDENEVMVKNRIPPEFYHRLIVPSQSYKDLLIIKLMNTKFVEKKDNKFYYNGIDLNEFIIVAKELNPNMFT